MSGVGKDRKPGIEITYTIIWKRIAGVALR